MLARELRAAFVAGTALSLAFAASPSAAQLVRSGDLVDAIDSGGNAGRLTVVNTSAAQTDMTVLAPVVVANWNRFNVPTGTTVAIANGTANPTATLVNRVIGATASDISGTISAPGINLWLINQNGILFGSGASVNSASFFASTLNVTDQDVFDFYEGTDLTGNGSGSIRFASSLGNGIASSSPNVNFVTDGTVLFVSEQLNLDATVNAGTGGVSFVAASDVSVSFTPGSPLSYVINAGTTVAEQSIGGSVTGNSIDVQMLTATGVVGALLQVDATLNATTAIATDSGVRLFAQQAGTGSVTVEMAGSVNSTGRINLQTDGDLTAAADLTGGWFEIRTGGNATLGNVTGTATNLPIRLDALGNLQAGTVQAKDNIFVSASQTGTATFDNLVSTDGALGVIGMFPGTFTVHGLTQGAFVDLIGFTLDLQDVVSTVGLVRLISQPAGELTVGNVTSADLVTMVSRNSIQAGDIVAKSGLIKLDAQRAITTKSLTSLAGGIDVDSALGGTLDLGNLSATTSISIDGAGALSAGSAQAANVLLGLTITPSSASFSGPVTTSDFFARVQSALTFGAVNRIGTISGLSVGSTLSLENDTANLVIADLVTAGSNDITIRNTGDIFIGASGQLDGRLVAIAAGDQFINLRGGDAVTASDRWAIYSAAPAGNTFGGLDSGNTAVWNGTFTTVAPATLTGNRYVFAFQPTLTVSSTSTSKVYGTDLTGSLNGFLSASGLKQGVAGAYLGDTLADVLSGSALITSAGSTARASVAGGPYVMTINQGTLATSRGYALALDSAGLLTVTSKPITGAVTVNNKTYDGSRTGTGTVTLDGVVTGDTVGTTGTIFTFADKNAGTGKTVAIAGTTLTGADAGNYTLTVPASALADIIARVLVITADDKQKLQGAPDPALTFQVGGQGLVAGHAISGALAREPGESFGDYAITRGTLDAGINYTLNFEGGTFAIVRPAFNQVPLRAQALPGDIPAPTVAPGLQIDASGVCSQEEAATCEVAQ